MGNKRLDKGRRPDKITREIDTTRSLRPKNWVSYKDRVSPIVTGRNRVLMLNSGKSKRKITLANKPVE